MGQKEVTEAWRNIWAQQLDKKIVLDDMSKTIFHEILRNCANLKAKKILEAGCGSGIISSKIAECGADVHLFDISPEALQIAQNLFISTGANANLIKGDITDFPFQENMFDIVWNSGVLEHFEYEFQLKAIQNLARSIKPGGLFISFNPYARALFYIMGKRYAEGKGTWPYGPEMPVKSLKKQCKKAGLTVSKEYLICFKESLSFLGFISERLQRRMELICKPFSEEVLMKFFGGYLLVTVGTKK